MLVPYDFIDGIKHIKQLEPRAIMSAFALNIYYGPDRHPFDVSQLFELVSEDRLSCVGALAWAFAQPRWPEQRVYMLGEDNFLDGSTEKWLSREAANSSGVPL